MTIKIPNSFFDVYKLGIASCRLVGRTPMKKNETLVFIDLKGRKATADVLQSKTVKVLFESSYDGIVQIKIDGIVFDASNCFQMFGFESLHHFTSFLTSHENLSIVRWHNFYELRSE